MQAFLIDTILAKSGKKHCRKTARSAFTLVEVVFALGLTMFAILPVVSLLSVALDTSANSNRTMFYANILQQLSSEANLADFNSLDKLAGTTKYFDEQGFEIPNGSAASNWSYNAVATLTKANSAWSEWSKTAYPSQSASYSSNMRRMQVVIYARSAPNAPSVNNIILSNRGF